MKTFTNYNDDKQLVQFTLFGNTNFYNDYSQFFKIKYCIMHFQFSLKVLLITKMYFRKMGIDLRRMFCLYNYIHFSSYGQASLFIWSLKEPKGLSAD